ncbi:hypothetical protein BG262_08385 [Floricoccus penangensis]|uniref:Uncharacterized protein n=1 Tax=Floricoccus penangensis TaxID=1859475 RepID=A0A9Q5JHK4_9LACT|nr:hypothetical protein BG262_08385 [Floricoccus penangensis]
MNQTNPIRIDRFINTTNYLYFIQATNICLLLIIILVFLKAVRKKVTYAFSILISLIGLVANYFYIAFDGVLIDNGLQLNLYNNVNVYITILIFILIVLSVILSFTSKKR